MRLGPQPGEEIDRKRPFTFRWNGQTVPAFDGDTIASALAASGLRVFSRSYKYHRPRGLLTASYHDPGCFFQVGDEPNVRGAHRLAEPGLDVRSQNTWPSLGFDVKAVNQLAGRFLGPGFYYKTFIKPQRLWPLYERVLQRFAHAGHISADTPRTAVDKRYAHPDVLVAGGGPAGGRGRGRRAGRRPGHAGRGGAPARRPPALGRQRDDLAALAGAAGPGRGHAGDRGAHQRGGGRALRRQLDRGGTARAARRRRAAHQGARQDPRRRARADRAALRLRGQRRARGDAVDRRASADRAARGQARRAGGRAHRQRRRRRRHRRPQPDRGRGRPGTRRPGRPGTSSGSAAAVSASTGASGRSRPRTGPRPSATCWSSRPAGPRPPPCSAWPATSPSTTRARPGSSLATLPDNVLATGGIAGDGSHQELIAHAEATGREAARRAAMIRREWQAAAPTRPPANEVRTARRRRHP